MFACESEDSFSVDGLHHLMTGRIAELLQNNQEQQEELGETVQDAVSQSLQGTGLSVSEYSIRNNRAEIDLDLSEIVEDLNDSKEFDGLEVTQSRGKLNIKKEYTADGGKTGNRHPDRRSAE